MGDTASPKLTELRTLYSDLDLLASILCSTTIPADFDLDEQVYLDHIHDVLQFCETMIRRLKVSMGPRPDLLDILMQWERGDLSNEMVEIVERGTGIQSTEFKEAKDIFESIEDIKNNTWRVFRVCQWKYTVILILAQWRQTLP